MKMEEIKIIRPAPKTNMNSILAAEATLKMKFPNDYKEFLIRINGGQSEVCVCDEPLLAISDWYSNVPITELPITSIIEANQILSEYTHGKFLAIAEDEANLSVLIILSGKNKYGIITCRIGEDVPEDLPVLFHSFSKMIEKLRICESRDAYREFLARGQERAMKKEAGKFKRRHGK